MKLRPTTTSVINLAACLTMMLVALNSSNQLFAQATETPTTETPTTETKTDWSAWNGTWKPASVKLGGQDMGAEMTKQMSLTMNDGTFEMTLPGVTETGTLKITDPGEDKPRHLDIITEKGPNAGKTVEAIYKIEDGKLIVCYGLSGGRPADFLSDQENPNLLIEYIKQKADDE